MGRPVCTACAMLVWLLLAIHSQREWRERRQVSKWRWVLVLFDVLIGEADVPASITVPAVLPLQWQGVLPFFTEHFRGCPIFLDVPERGGLSSNWAIETDTYYIVGCLTNLFLIFDFVFSLCWLGSKHQLTNKKKFDKFSVFFFLFLFFFGLVFLRIQLIIAEGFFPQFLIRRNQLCWR